MGFRTQGLQEWPWLMEKHDPYSTGEHRPPSLAHERDMGRSSHVGLHEATDGCRQNVQVDRGEQCTGLEEAGAQLEDGHQDPMGVGRADSRSRGWRDQEGVSMPRGEAAFPEEMVHHVLEI